MSEKSGGSGTVIKPCTCKHEYQDQKFGFGNRIHNNAAAKSGHKCRCTVCGDKKVK